MRNVLSVLCYQRGAEETEADYARFCKLTKPLLTMGVFLFALWLVCVIAGLIAIFIGSLVSETPIDPRILIGTSREPGILIVVAVYLGFTGLPVIVGIRGRALVPALLRGRLSWTGMAIVGVACGVGHVLLSMLIGLPFLNPLTFHPEWVFEGMYLAFLAGPCTEEALYQVGLQTALQRFGPIVAVIGATLPFWGVHLWHGQIPFLGAVIYTLLACLIFGVIRQTTKSTGAAIIAHSVGNMIVQMAHPV